MDAPDLQVQPLPAYSDVTSAILSHKRAYDGWIHPPLAPASLSQPSPEIPAIAYKLPATHQLTGEAEWMDPEYAGFVIALIGMLDGLRLVPEGWSHFHKAAVAPMKLADIVCTAREVAKAIDLASQWWKAANQECRKWMFGSIHWYCFASGYDHEFERFGGLNTVLDTMHRIHIEQGGTRARTYAQQTQVLAKAYGIPVPPWAVVRGKSCDLSALRNEFIHEGRYGGEPIGFAFPKRSITLELAAFMTRLILAVLGVECGYIHSSTTTWQMHGLDFSIVEHKR